MTEFYLLISIWLAPTIFFLVKGILQAKKVKQPFYKAPYTAFALAYLIVFGIVFYSIAIDAWEVWFGK